MNTGIDYYTHERYGAPSMYRNRSQTEADKGTYCTYLFEREALRFLDQHAAKEPFFLYVPYTAVHLPINEPTAWVEKAPDTITTDIARHYAACVMHLDDGVVESLETTYLKEIGAAAKEKGLYLEYNFSMDMGGMGIGIQHDLGIIS